MREAINGVLRNRLAERRRVVLYGQDIEDPKGDVFGVTQGLSTTFPDRVINAPLSESTIVGTCIGRALAGQRPVAFIQFADFFPLAYNQIVSELGSIYWRTERRLAMPGHRDDHMRRIQAGLGPFHSQTFESIAAHTPGVDVVMPSSAGDAAGLLNAAFESGRPHSVLLSEKLPESRGPRHVGGRPIGNSCPWARRGTIPIGRRSDSRHVGKSTSPSASRRREVLADAGVSVDLFDLRSLSPWDEEAIVASAEATGRLVVVHEDNHTCGFGAEVVATACEKTKRPLQVRRITRPGHVLCLFISAINCKSFPRSKRFWKRARHC